MKSNESALNLPSLTQAINYQPIIVSCDTLVTEIIPFIGVYGSCTEENYYNTLTGSQLIDVPTEKSNIQGTCVLVMESSQIRGIVTKQDLLKTVASGKSCQNKIKVCELMTQRVITLKISEAQDIFTPLLFFRQHKIRHLPILDRNDELLGIVTPGSILQALKPSNLLKLGTVGEVMNTQLLSVDRTASVLNIAQLMAEHRVSCVVITEEEEVKEKESHIAIRSIPVGIITEHKIFQALALGLDLAQTPTANVMRRLGNELNPTNSLLYAYQQMQSDRMETLLVSERRGDGLGARLGIITEMELLRSLEPVHIYQRLKRAQQSVHQLELEKTELLRSRNAELEQQVQQRTSELQAALHKVEQQAKQADLVNQIVQAMRGSLVLDEVLQTTVNQLHEALKVSCCLIFRPDSQNHLVVHHVSEATKGGENFLGIQCNFYHYYHSQLLKGETIILPSIDRCLDSDLQKSAQECSIQSIAIMPLIYKQSYIGAISLHECDRQREWTIDEVSFLKAIGDHCAMAIHQAELYQQVQNELFERQKAEETLRQREALLETIVTNLPIVVYALDQQGVFTFSDGRGLEIMGLKPQQLVGQSIFDYYRHYPSITQNIADALVGRENPWLSEYENRIFDHRTRVILDKNGEINGLIGVATDITKYKQAEAALRESEAKFRALSECSPVGIFMADIEGSSNYTNPRCQAICGFSFMEGLGYGWLNFVHPEEREWVATNFSNYTINRRESFCEYRFLHKDETIRWVQVRTAPLFLAENELIGFVGTVQDITESKQAQEQLQCSLQEKEVLLKEVHHRVKNNLQIIYSLLDLQSQQIQDSHTLEMFGASKNRIKSMALIHEQLYQSENMARINFADYINTLANYLQQAYVIDPCQITVELDLEPICLNIDTAIPCGLIINELVVNAFKHAFPENRKGRILVSLKYLNGQINLKVQDNGCNSGNLNFSSQSTLGIKLVNILVKQLEGKIEVGQNEGTTFKIQFSELEY